MIAPARRYLAFAMLVLLVVCGRDETYRGDREAAAEIRVLVIGDGYLPTEKETFLKHYSTVEKADPLLPRDVLLNFTFKPEFVASDKTGESKLGIKHNGQEKDCYFDFDATVIKNVEALGKGFKPDYYVVVFNKGNNHGCASKRVMFIEGRPTKYLVAHEMGHSVVSLYDERGGGGTKPITTDLNCTATPNNPPWAHLKLGKPKKGCNLRDDLFRPRKNCRMNSHETKRLCDRCDELVRRHMKARVMAPPLSALLPRPSGLPPAPPPLDSLEITAVVSTSGKFEVTNVTEVSAAEIQAPLMTGETFFVVSALFPDDVRRVIGVAPQAMDDGDRIRAADGRFELSARSYGDKGKERLVPIEAALVRVTLVGVQKSSFTGKDLQLHLRSVPVVKRGEALDVATINLLTPPPFHDTGIKIEPELAAYFATHGPQK